MFQMPRSSPGVWAVCHLDYGDVIEKVYNTEIEALREINARGYGHVRFLAWGKDLHDMDQEAGQ